MIKDIFENLRYQSLIHERLSAIKEGCTWEQIALALYQILNDIDTASVICKEDLKAFQDVVMGMQAKKNQFLFSPDGYTLQPCVDIDGEIDGQTQTASYPDLMKYNFTRPAKMTQEAVATKSVTKQLLDYYGKKVNSKLKPSTRSGENWLKFWLLKNGDHIPVEVSHSDTTNAAGVYFWELVSEGGIPGYIKLDLGEIGVERKANAKQISKLKQWYVQYKPTVLVYLNKRKPIKNLEEFEYYLKYPEMMERTDPIAEISDDGENEGEYEKGGFNSKLKSGRDISRYPSSRPAKMTQEAVATKSVTKQLLGYYGKKINSKLKPSTWPGENWLKFWLLKNGDILPVEVSHSDTTSAAGVSFWELVSEGGIPGYIKLDLGEIGVDEKVNSKQIAKLKQK